MHFPLDRRTTVQVLSIALFCGLLIFGIYSLVVYVGVEVHMVSLLTEQDAKTIKMVCSESFVDGKQVDFLCTGWRALVGVGDSWFPVLRHFFLASPPPGPNAPLVPSFIEPFWLYVLWSVLLYGAIVGFHWLRTNSTRVRFQGRPWMVVALFFAMLWLLFTTLSRTVVQNYFPPPGENIYAHQFVEPLPQVYVGISPQALQELKKQFDGLKANGCLTQIGKTGNGAGIFTMHQSCMQWSFITVVLPPILFIGLFFFELLVLGHFLLSLLGIRQRGFPDMMLSLAAGVCGWIALLWTVAVIGILTTPVGWGLMILLPAALYRSSRHWIDRFTSATVTMDWSWNRIQTLLGWLLLSYLALNALSVVRPFPIGWDDLGSYLNRPRLMVSYGHFIFSMAQFQWEYITGLGFLLFGNEPKEVFGATTAMMINWSGGLLAVLGIVLFARRHLGAGAGLLAALLYYTLPLVGHFSFADMKIDNALFFMETLATYALFRGLFPDIGDDPDGQEDRVSADRWLLLAGIFIAFAFSMKPTAAMVLLAIGAVLIGVRLHWWGFVGGMFFGIAALTQQTVLRIDDILERVGFQIAGAPAIALYGSVLVGLLCVGAAYLRHRESFPSTARIAGIFAGAFLLGIAPWILHNNLMRGWILPRFEMGAPNALSPTIALRGRGSVADYGQDIRVLPPELQIDLDHPACKATGTMEELDRYWGFEKGWKHYLTLPWRTVMNMDAYGYYVTTMPALLLLPFLLLLPYFWSDRARWLRWLLIATVFMLLEWMLLANGIPWYGIGMFLGLVIGLEALVMRAPDLPNASIMTVLLAVSLFVNFGHRFMSFAQQKAMLDYPFGKNSAAAIMARTVPYYGEIAAMVLQRHEVMKDRPYLFRVGTFIPYFIPRNLEVIGLADHQLDIFNCLYQDQNPALMVRRLKALGFNSIILDTNTWTIERDPNGPLHKKYNLFAAFFESPNSGLDILVKDTEAGLAFALIP